MTDTKASKRRLSKLKAQHWNLDKIVLHMTAQAAEAHGTMAPAEYNRLADFKKRKLALRDEISRIEAELKQT